MDGRRQTYCPAWVLKIAAISASQRLSNVIPAEILALGPSCISQRPQLKRE